MSNRPNILLLMADQLKADALGCAGNPVVRTPHIDRLAREGSLFESCFVQSTICVPSRSSFLTGRYVHTHGVWANRCALPDRETALGRLFQDAGYHTALVGSNHIFRDPGFFGFETFRYHEWPWVELAAEHEHHKVMRYAGPSPFAAEESSSHQIGEAMVELIEDDEARPLFAWVSFFDPHPPYTPPRPYDTMYDPGEVVLPDNFADACEDKPPWIRRAYANRACLTEAERRKVIACYYGQISFLDEQVGKIIAALERAGKLDDTIIAFTSDHGDFMAEHGLLGKPSSFYDCLARVPMILWGPGRIEMNGRVDALVESIDLAPALLAAAGIDPPVHVQGRDLLSVASGRAPARDAVFCEAAMAGIMKQGGNVFGVMARTRHHKLCAFSDGEEELYDLENDPGETRNLASEPGYRGVRAELYERLARWYLETHDQHPWAAVGNVGHQEWAAFMNAPRSNRP